MARRDDGYHDIETIFYPIPLHDELHVEQLTQEESATPSCKLVLKGCPIEGNPSDNLVVRTYNLLANDFPLPPLRATLYKHIPTQAGLGGGSSDAAHMLKAVNKLCCLRLDTSTLQHYASRLGADCPFFIASQPCFATGIGDELTPIDLNLSSKYILMVKPDDAVSTREAYSCITPSRPVHSCRTIVGKPLEHWQAALSNDFEASILPRHPLIAGVKHRLLALGAEYVQMTGSGSVVYALSSQPLSATRELDSIFPDCWWEEIAL